MTNKYEGESQHEAQAERWNNLLALLTQLNKQMVNTP